MTWVALGLGSNLGNRLLNLRNAVRCLEQENLTVIKTSDVFETPPWGVFDQPHFLNACLLCEASQEPEVLLDLVKTIETKMGRTATRRWGERLIDIDILLLENKIYQSSRLTIPHKELENRCFVLLPLVQILPDGVHPFTGRTFPELAASCPAMTRICKL